jgi:hypothetical protein
MVHVDLSGGLDVFMAQDSLSVLHSAVLLEVSAQCATEDLECAELAWNVECIRDGPYRDVTPVNVPVQFLACFPDVS